MLFELMRIGSPRYCPELAGVRARFFTYKDCEPKVVLQYGAAPSSAAYQAAALLLSYRRKNGGPGGSCNLTKSD